MKIEFKVLDEIKDTIKKEGIKKSKLAKDLGMSNQGLSLNLNGKTSMPIDRAEWLLNILGYELKIVKKGE